MLEKIDVRKISDVAREKGFAFHSLYAEQREERFLNFQGRQERARVQNEEYSKLGLEKENVFNTYFIESIATPQILTLFGEPKALAARVPTHKATSLQSLTERRNTLEQLIKKANLDLDQHPAPQISYKETKKNFLVGGVEGSSVLGEETYASLEAHFQQGNRTFSISKHTRSVDEFWESLKDQNILEPKFPVGWENPWPAPEGKLPIHWSSLAVSKLLLPFMKTFDSKRVEAHKSLLNQWPKTLPLRFDLEDKPDTSLSAYDTRGNLKTSAPLLVKGQPVSFLKSESPGFWHVVLNSQYQQENLLSELNLGVSVNDIRVEGFDPETGQIIFTLMEASLLHHGEVGECILPVSIQCSLLDLFGSWECFSKKFSKFGYWASKGPTSFLTEFSVPEAYSREFFLPGTVSKSHYW